MSDKPMHIAFILVDEVKTGVMRGGMLITDANGKPVEFRCTSPIKPNAVQKTLYGNTLMPHIASELVDLPLLVNAQTKPSVVLVQQEEFLSMRAKQELPLILARRQGQDMKVATEENSSSPEELVTSPSGKFAPIVLTSHWDFAGDIAQCKQALGSAFATCDLLEPFERVRAALATVHEQGVLSE